MEGVPIDGILSILGCLVLSAFFSGSETALTSISRARAQQMYEQSGQRRSLRRLVEQPVVVLTTILIGNNLVNITASALATNVAEEMLGGGADGQAIVSPVAVAIGVMTLLLLTFGEITPKALARAHAERIAPILMVLLTPLIVVLRPFTWAFVALSNGVAWFTGKPLQEDGPFVREEDIEYLVELGHREGTLSAERETLLRSVFDFTETAVREVMVPRTDVVFVPADISEDELFDLIVKVGHSRLPVYDGNVDNIIGLVYAKDMLRHMRDRRKGKRFELRHFLRRPEFVPQSKPIAELLREMQANRVHMAAVVDEFGGVAGIVTLEDIMEELFGEIRDEYDVESDLIEQLPDGTWRIEAKVNLEDLGEALGIEGVEDEDCDTLGGYISKMTGEVGNVGTEVEAWGLRFVVEEADPRRIRWVRAEALQPSDPSGETSTPATEP